MCANIENTANAVKIFSLRVYNTDTRDLSITPYTFEEMMEMIPKHLKEILEVGDSVTISNYERLVSIVQVKVREVQWETNTINLKVRVLSYTKGNFEEVSSKGPYDSCSVKEQAIDAIMHEIKLGVESITVYREESGFAIILQ